MNTTEDIEMLEDKGRACKIIELLDSAYPDAPMTYLNHRNAFEMLIATILSANTTDACVNKVSPELFKRYPNARSLMTANIESLVDIIRPCGSYNKKSVYIRDTAGLLVEKFSENVPQTMKELVTLPGVNRKTANVVLSVVFKINEGVVVDTHVMRVTQRLGFTHQKTNREKVEKELKTLLLRHQWYEYARLIGAHGRRTCSARRPRCPDCAINHLCPSAVLELA
ncbi:MAG: endonuclease III domain-containing protein [Candidatus Hodarchaeota archaeon]